jgi:hypothetical protein
MKEIAKALVAAQKEMGNAIKDSKNPFFKSSYADLNSVREACLPALNAQGIVVLQPICQFEGKNYVKTILMHESGELVESLTEIIFSKQNDAQSQGSGITYARRYGLQSLVCIGAEDDDGNKASEQPKNQFSGMAETADEDMKATLRKANEDSFRLIKKGIEAADTLEEMAATWNEQAKTINKLKKYTPDLYQLLINSKELCKSEMIAGMKMANDLGDGVDYTVAG